MQKILLMLLLPLTLVLSSLSLLSLLQPTPESLYPTAASQVIKLEVKAKLPDDPFLHMMLAMFSKLTGRPVPKFLRQSGSGVILDNQGRVVTANHVIEIKDRLTIVGVTTGGKRFGCRVLSTDDSRDLALLACDGLIGTRGIRGLASVTLPIGSRACAAGFASGGPFILSDGILANRMNDKGKLLLSVPAGPGMSGGAVFTYDGYLVGIVQAGYRQPPFTLITTSNVQLRKFLRDIKYN